MRNKILQKAGDMFLSLGFKSVTMDDIATEMGVSKKTIYKYFSNKVKLVEAVIEEFQIKIDEEILRVKNKNLNAIEEEFAVKAIFKDMFKNAKTSPMFQLKKYYPQIFEKLMEREVCTFEECNLDNLTKGKLQGLYRENINNNLISKFYFTLIFEIYETDIAEKNMQTLINLEYKVLEYHIRAIATPKGVEELENQLKLK
ncbi:TetR/AcrR family transcriptional regulator [Polaribacter sp. Z022]|uniref:TetR/AcrR family transcriptional regulator n=1 Tax=Polaribacter sp. Z022 TaxID=2927125 RepID=UPI0020200C99|nr:TetR/AcrR family transcriptional regulator [Polaribacter sp. Z022]MCL7754570.1 TetR/AcrR family transcriptional regulator [Polaribacter sp. Z022]